MTPSWLTLYPLELRTPHSAMLDSACRKVTERGCDDGNTG